MTKDIMQEIHTPAIKGPTVPKGFELDSSKPLILGRKVLSLKPDLRDESVLGFPEIQPFMHLEDDPALLLLTRKQAALTKNEFASAANIFAEDDPVRTQEQNGAGFLRIFPARRGSQLATIRLKLVNDTPLANTVFAERNYLFETYVNPAQRKNALTSILGSLSLPNQLLPMMAERINNTPVDVTLGAVSLGNGYVEPILGSTVNKIP